MAADSAMTLSAQSISLDLHSLLPFAILAGILAGIRMVVDQWKRDKRRENRRTYYREDYLKSDNWKRKRALVLKRDRYLRLNVAAVPTSRGNWLTHKSAYGIEPERFVRRTTIPHKRAA